MGTGGGAGRMRWIIALAGGPAPAALPGAAGGPWTPSDYWRRRAHRLAKRGLDIAAASLALLVLLPLLLIVAALVRLSSPGPVVFRQRRLGEGGRPFQMYKFRTMFAGADSAVH